VLKELLTEALMSLFNYLKISSGTIATQNYILIHKRLSIVDIEKGHQPLFNENKKISMVCNGEIYNYKKLYKELKEDHKISTKSDSEVLFFKIK
jgi:asparagine synthase (glutamine-hydrolysing)